MQQTLQTLKLGDHVPTFNLPGSDGKAYSLASFHDKNALVVIFLANHCPYVSSWEDRIVDIARHFSDDAAFIGISSNDVDNFPQDGPEAMAQRVSEKGYPFPYLFDENQAVARAFGARRTPEVFVFDQERVLRYHGAVDSDWEEDAPDMQHYLRDALTGMLDSVVGAFTPETPVVGCTIKWKE